MSTCILAGHDLSVRGISWVEEVGRLVLAYAFWVGLTVLVVVALERLKRWLLGLAQKKKHPEDQGV